MAWMNYLSVLLFWMLLTLLLMHTGGLLLWLAWAFTTFVMLGLLIKKQTSSNLGKKGDSMNSGFGKTILFGEHFVVYGIPAIASQIDRKTTAAIEEYDDGVVVSTLGLEKNSLDNEKLKGLKESLNIILKELELEDKSFHLKIDSDIEVGSGMGSSAALAVGTVRALNEKYSLGLNDEKINKVAHESEKHFHGTPSGIDDTVATFGGLVWFQKNLEGGPNTIEQFSLKQPLKIVIGCTGKKGNTGELVAGVREKKEANPEEYEKIFKEAEELVKNAKKALQDGNNEEIGKLMNQNHDLLVKIGVSTDELEELCSTALEKGAKGAKLTGAGGGGCMIALTPTDEIQNNVAKAFESKNYKAIKTSIG